MRALELLEQASRLLIHSQNLTRSLNTLLCLIQDAGLVENPLLLLSDSVTQRYFIELAPSISEEEKAAQNRLWKKQRKDFLESLHHELLLAPHEVNATILPFEAPLMRPGRMFYSFPLRGGNELPQGMLCGWLEPQSPSATVQALRLLAGMITLSLKAYGLRGRVIREVEEPDVPEVLEGVVSGNSQMIRLAEMVRRISPSRATVLLRGESGTGKELFANAIHRHSLRRNAPFKVVNCGALSNTLLESELFGHEKGAFTGATGRRRGWFELADGGTLFLDEVGNTSLELQAKLLRVLQEGTFERLGGEETVTVDVRVVCATNAPLETAIAQGTFREDLFYRINVVPLELVPLRKRKDDIPLLVRKFLADFNAEYGQQVLCPEEELRLLEQHDWPGNIRELQNVVQSAFLMAENNRLAIRTMLATHQNSVQLLERHEEKLMKPQTALSLEEEEVRAIEGALRDCRGVQQRAAKQLGISLRQLRYRIEKYGITVRKIRC